MTKKEVASRHKNNSEAKRVVELVAENDAMDLWLPNLVYAICSRTLLSDENLSEEYRKLMSDRYENLAIESIKEFMNDPDGTTADPNRCQEINSPNAFVK